jgi:site-specific DNA-methyltransferase (adenine-specific)
MEREKAALGLFLMLNKPTREMEREAASAGMYETGGMKFPKIQILTAEQILDNRRPQVPFNFTEGLLVRKRTGSPSYFDRGFGYRARLRAPTM